MKKRPCTAIMIAVTMLISLVSSPFVASSTDVLAATAGLSKKKMNVCVGEKKILKMKNTTRTVNWSVKSGKGNVVLKNKKKTRVAVKGRKIGTAVVKAVIKYSSTYKKTYTCKVNVTGEKWECPVCGFMNTDNYCANCGHVKPGLEEPTVEPGFTVAPSVAPTVTPAATLTPTPSVSPAPTLTPSPSPTVPAATAPYGTLTPSPSASPTATPINPDAISWRYLWMTINRQVPIIVQVYQNNVATKFYDDINSSSPTMNSFAMAPAGENEFAGYLPNVIELYPSKSYNVAAGEIFLYDTVTLKISATEHATGAYPTRIAKVRAEDIPTLEFALSYKVDGKTWVEFAPYKV